MTRLPLLALPLLLLLGLPAPAHASPWVPPLPAPLEVTRGFDPPETRYGPGHRGVDLAAPAGTVVRAAGAGRVSFAGVLAGRGVVAVVHGDLRTTYEPVAAGVSVGDRVAVGEPLGLLERGHSPCRACLHWGLRRGDSYLDPLSLLRRGPSVLLPLTASDRALARAGRLVVEPAGRSSAGPLPAASAGAPPPAAARQPVESPGWSLRAADLPLAAGAVLALVAGLVLLSHHPRPRPSPDPDDDPDDDPPVAPAASTRAPGSWTDPVHTAVQALPPPARGTSADAEPDGVIDLAAERLRRRGTAATAVETCDRAAER